MEEGIAFIVDEMGFLLPPLAYWSPEEWGRKGGEYRELVAQQLGWDITDFGSGDFRQVGLILFTLRNVTPEDLERGDGEVFAEKVIVVRESQVTPTHFHYRKM